MKFTTALAQVADAALSVVAPKIARERSDQPRHSLEMERDEFAVRRYEPMLVAQVTVAGDRKEAADKAFGKLAGYIFASNRDGPEISMTTPVMQAPAGADPMMTVSGGGTAAGRYTVRFMMPHEWTTDTLPPPSDESIAIETVPARRMAVVTFSGKAEEDAVRERAAALEAFIAAEGFERDGTVEYAYYDPPFTPPPLRRNEVMMGLAG